jgi:tetratricopeptide (TPR) repeat protein
MGMTYSYQGNPERGAQYCSEALALGPLPYDAATAKGARGYAEIRAGRVEAGIADLREAVAWLDRSNLRYPRWRFSLLLSEGYLRAADRTAARSLAEDVLEQSRGMGYLHFEGMASWLMGECLSPEDPSSAELYVENAMDILGQVGARNDLARAMVTRAALRQAAGDVAAARALLDRAYTIFQTLGTLDEPLRVEAARAALDRGAPIGLLCGTNVIRRSPRDRAV